MDKPRQQTGLTGATEPDSEDRSRPWISDERRSTCRSTDALNTRRGRAVLRVYMYTYIVHDRMQRRVPTVLAAYAVRVRCMIAAWTHGRLA